MKEGLSVITGPVLEPLTLAEAKAFLHVDGSDEDATITFLIQSAREDAEAVLDRYLLTQTVDVYLDCFPVDEIQLRAPLQSVTLIEYTDTAKQVVTLDPSKYLVDPFGEIPRIAPNYGCYWPSTLPIPNAVRIQCVFGWTAANLVPAGIRLAMQQLIGTWFKHREMLVEASLNQLPRNLSADRLYSPHRLLRK